LPGQVRPLLAGLYQTEEILLGRSGHPEGRFGPGRQPIITVRSIIEIVHCAAGKPPDQFEPRACCNSSGPGDEPNVREVVTTRAPLRWGPHGIADCNGMH